MTQACPTCSAPMENHFPCVEHRPSWKCTTCVPHQTFTETEVALLT